jgi:tetratricopeptide (TPR) repeat protein
MAETLDSMFQDAVEALRENEKARAKDILTRLIKTDPNRATYWIWLSAAVDTRKECIYCLETALKLDPANATAKRGLRLMGELPPDENVQPFQIKRTRAWEEKLFLAYETPPQWGLADPLVRLAGVVLVAIVAAGLVVLGIFNPRALLPQISIHTPGASATYALTPTFVYASPAIGATPGKPTPLAVLLGIFYTPTPLYVSTPRPPQSLDNFRAAQAAFSQGNWDEYFQKMELIAKVEPQSADVPYMIGEGYRAKGDCRSALDYYNNSLKLDSTFAPGYLGLARARQCIEPGADTLGLYDLALKSDPYYGEVYLDRANFYLGRKDYAAALPDLDHAYRLMPRSALVQLAYAQTYLMQGNDGKALQAAQKANTFDLTLLPSYYYVGRAYIENGRYAEAIKPLQIYVVYQPKDAGAFALLGRALAETGDYRAAIEALNQTIRLDPNQVGSFIYLGLSYLRLDNLAGGEVNYKRALEYFPDSFDANIGLTEIYYKKGTFGTAYLQAETAKSKATNDRQLALAIYWRALCQEGRQSFGDAIKDWKTLLSMPLNTMTPQMRKDAQEHLRNIVPPTNTPGTPKPTGTPTITPTPRPGMTATPAPSTKTPIPSATP